jgi:hypothetical protein
MRAGPLAAKWGLLLLAAVGFAPRKAPTSRATGIVLVITTKVIYPNDVASLGIAAESRAYWRSVSFLAEAHKDRSSTLAFPCQKRSPGSPCP